MNKKDILLQTIQAGNLIDSSLQLQNKRESAGGS